MTGQCVIKHYLSARKVQAEFAWSVQIPEKTIYQEGEQDYSTTDPLGETDFKAIQRHF